MPLAIPALALLALLAVVLLAVALTFTLRNSLIAAAERVPIIGSRIAVAISNFFAAISDYRDDRMHDASTKLGAWLNALAGAMRTPLDELRAFSTQVKDALEYVATELVPAKIRAVTNPITTRLNGAVTRIDGLRGDLTDFSNGIESRVRQLTAQVWDRAIGPLAALETTFNSFRTGIEGRVRQLTEQLWTQAIQPIGRVIDFDLPNIRIDAADLRKAIDSLREFAVPISLVFTGAAVVELLRHVRKCKSKTEKLCEFDMDAYDDLLGLMFVLPSLPLIIEAMRGSAKLLDEVLPDIREMLR